jgi:5-methylcytosine-specific restriction endonuclease McrBC regulatory subunit McrC
MIFRKIDNHTELLQVREYTEETFPNFTKQDVAYLDKDCFKPSKGTPPYKVRQLSDNKISIENTSYAGLIQLQDKRIHFSTKVKTNLFYMLSFLKDENSFLYDQDKMIDIKEGANFFDIIGRLFLNELDEIYKRGFYKKYVHKEENIRFVKGRLLIKSQIQNDIRKKPNFYCAYDDLTFDNLENRIILKATLLLIPLIRFNEMIKRDLIRHSFELRELASLINVVPEDCDRIQYSKLNEYYEPIISLAKVILRFHFIRSTQEGMSKGFSFIVNMNKVYEDFITEIVEEVINEDDKFNDYQVEKQARFDRLVQEKKLITKPDIILRRKNAKDDFPLIIDAKYKRQPSNADYYQVIAYALALPTAKACCLIYPEDEEIEDSVLTLDTSPFVDPGRKVKLHAIQVNLGFNNPKEPDSFSKYIENIKGQMREKIQTVLDI